MWLHDTWAAFWKLSTCRNNGFGAGPIPWTALNDYAIRNRINGDCFDEFETLINAMDSAYLAAQQAKQDAKK